MDVNLGGMYMSKNLVDGYLENRFGVRIIYGNDDYRVIDTKDNTLYVGMTYSDCIQYVQDVLLEGH